MITFDGLEDIINSLDKIQDEDSIKKALGKACALVEREAKMKAPKGEIARSITSDIDGLTGIVHTPLEYAPYVEYGTGMFSDHPQGGRKETPWVYVKNSTVKSKKKTLYTEQSAKKMVAIMREAGLDAYMTYGQEPQPYLRPALNENRDKIKQILREGIGK